MYGTSTGYGIAGMKNSYNLKVKLDNWVEDEAGIYLTQQPRPSRGLYLSNAQEKHCDPREMTAHPSMTSIKMLSVAELKAKNKDGTSYAELFNHGPDMSRDERFNSTYKRLFARDSAAAFARQDLGLEKEKNKEQTREIKGLTNLQSTYKLMNAHNASPSSSKDAPFFHPRAALGESMPVVRCGKSHVLSQTY